MLIEALRKFFIVSERAAPSFSSCAGGESSMLLP